MEHTFDFSLIIVEPDARRGERVNVGLVVFKPEGLDVRIVESRKVSFIDSMNWDSFLRSFEANLADAFGRTRSVSEVRDVAAALGRKARLSEPGWFSARNSDEYEDNVKRIIERLISRPKKPRRISDTSVATQIAASFKSAEILANPGDSLSSGRVIRNFSVDESAGLIADFALKNGSLHVATTVNLTTTNPHIGTSASKAITMDKAKRTLDSAKAYCVYAVAPSRSTEVREHISLLRDYADDVFNWLEPDDQKRFKHLFFDAYRSNFPSALEKRMH